MDGRRYKQETYVEMQFRTRDEARAWISSVKKGLLASGFKAEYTGAFKNLYSEVPATAWAAHGAFTIELEQDGEVGYGLHAQ